MSENDMFDTDMDTPFSPEVGTAYHAFLEHVNFGSSAEEELARMAKENVLPAEQLALLDCEKLSAILALPYLAGLKGKVLRREQKFLVALPACDFPEAYGGTHARDEVIFQGAIDLLVEEGGGAYTVVDYKFSSRSDGQIRERYAPQMKLYRKAVAKILHTGEDRVAVRILNIARGREIGV